MNPPPSPLDAGDFAAFVRTVHGYEPYPWQVALADRLCSGAPWPDVLPLPTGLGKTTAIDVALFHLAWEHDRSAAERRAARRIFVVIDRRVVVDQTFEHARVIARRLAEALAVPSDAPPVLRAVAERLQALDPAADRPLRVVALRGGLYQEGAWARSPAQATVCVSTVDQVGSRLLFRGYGLSDRARPVHAGLTGNDALLLIDEAHLSRAFLQTLDHVARYRGGAWAERPVPAPFGVVRLSATFASGDAGEALLTMADRAVPRAGRCLAAAKRARLVSVDAHGTTEGELPAAFATALAEEARGLLRAKDVPTVRLVGVVVNRVDTARRVHQLLSGVPDADAVLLTGRVRGVDRGRVVARIVARCGNQHPPSRPEERPLFVVATQTIEVGADLDFDALVTEAAPLDALRQRFGRLDRRGERGTSPAVVAVRKDLLRAPDPVYGRALAATWAWLNGKAEKRGRDRVVDFGIDALSLPPDEELESLCAPVRPAPTVLPATVDAWVQTCPAPAADPDPALFLHGEDAAPADVQVVWRADLPPTLRPEERDDLVATVALVPPSSAETLALPLWALRAWLRGRAAGDIADVEGAGAPDEPFRPNPGRLVLRWRGLDESDLALPAHIRPGDTVVVPASWGGLDDFGWAPECEAAVVDRADEAAWVARRRAVLRLHPNVVASWWEGGAPPSLPEGHDLADAAAAVSWVRSWEAVPDWLAELRQGLSVGARTIPYPAATGDARAVVISARRRGAAELSTDDDTASCTAPVLLAEHAAHVAETARLLAHACGLPRERATDLWTAGRVHDLGKLDPRFQVMLHDGDAVAALAAEHPLAKSGMTPDDREAFRRARDRAGFPPGQRHELLSVALAQSAPGLLDGTPDPDLVLHLVGTHHGWGRAFPPVVADAAPVRVEASWDGQHVRASSAHGLERLDSGWVERFWRLVRRYGPWGLAWLETVFRLADGRASAQEGQERKP